MGTEAGERPCRRGAPGFPRDAPRYADPRDDLRTLLWFSTPSGKPPDKQRFHSQLAGEVVAFLLDYNTIRPHESPGFRRPLDVYLADPNVEPEP